jgi:hypothetical protein
MQPVEIRDAVDAAVDYERSSPVLERGLDDQRIAARPVVAVPGEQPHALALGLNGQAMPSFLISWS